MPSMTIKNIPDDLYEMLKKKAQEHGRSINNEVIFCLKRSLQAGRIDPEAFLARVERLHEQISPVPHTDEILRAAKEEGRP